MNVSTNMLEKLGAAPLVYHTLTDPELSKMSDDEFRAYCERVWFYRGDHERTIQSRMAILREYVPDFRGIAREQLRRHKKIEYKPLADEEMRFVRRSRNTARRAITTTRSSKIAPPTGSSPSHSSAKTPARRAPRPLPHWSASFPC